MSPKVAIVFGESRGIGAAIALRLGKDADGSLRCETAPTPLTRRGFSIGICGLTGSL
jgi:hypothetical protein